MLSRLLQHFNKFSLANEHLDNPDILGSAYEYLIREFADDGGKKSGEFYTPKEKEIDSKLNGYLKKLGFA